MHLMKKSCVAFCSELTWVLVLLIEWVCWFCSFVLVWIFVHQWWNNGDEKARRLNGCSSDITKASGHFKGKLIQTEILSFAFCWWFCCTFFYCRFYSSTASNKHLLLINGKEQKVLTDVSLCAPANTVKYIIS